MIKFVQHGNFKKLNSFMERLLEIANLGELNKYGEIGVAALAAQTPRRTGKTAESWDYIIERKRNSVSIVWTNSNVNDNVNIAILIQYGHGLKNGAYVQGSDYINPALKDVFRQIADDIWKEVSDK